MHRLFLCFGLLAVWCVANTAEAQYPYPYYAYYPAPVYAAPVYVAPAYAAPVVTYKPVVAYSPVVTYSPVVAPAPVVVGYPPVYVGRVKTYVGGQPVRNVFRAITPGVPVYGY